MDERLAAFERRHAGERRVRDRGPAAPTWPRLSAAINARLSISAPRLVLINITPGFIRASDELLLWLDVVREHVAAEAAEDPRRYAPDPARHDETDGLAVQIRSEHAV